MWSWLWPDINSMSDADQAVITGAGACAFSAGVTALLSITGWMGYTIGSLMDAALFAGLALWIWKKQSRVGAVLALVIYVGGQSLPYIVGPGTKTFPYMAIFFTSFMVSAVRGTLYLHKHKGDVVPPAEPVAPADPPALA